MKKAILIVLMALMLVIPAYAAESVDDPIVDRPVQQEQDKEPVVVSTLDELQAAINAAEDRDTIYISKRIWLNDVPLICDKDITIRGLEQAQGLFSLSGDCVLSGFNFIVDCRGSTVALIENNGFRECNIKITDCRFWGDENNNNFLLNIFSGNIEIQDCTFQNKAFSAISTGKESTVAIKDCFFSGAHTLYVGGAIYNSGDLTIYNTEIINNASGKGGAIYNDGLLTISNSTIKGNTGKNEFDVVEGNDIFSCGVLTITDEQSADAGFYEETTGEKLTLPLVNYTDTAKLTYLTEEQAAEYFAHGEDTPPEQPQEPGDQTGDDDTTGGEQPPQEPIQPPAGEDGDDSTNTPTEAPEQPIEPPKDDTPDNPADSTPDTPQQPQKPADSDNGNNDNYTPPTDYRPSQRPTWPVVTVKPTECKNPQAQPDTPAPTKPQLACNGAVIDASKTVVLLGYGDGLLHENDPLTRAQLATIIFRLLDADSIARYSNAELAFTDVAADAWYAPYVGVIKTAGVVNGVGGGKYDPNGLVRWSQILAVLSRFVEPQEYTLQNIQYSGWAVEAVQTAVALGWIEDKADFNPDAVIGRGELAQLINNVLALYR